MATHKITNQPTTKPIATPKKGKAATAAGSFLGPSKKGKAATAAGSFLVTKTVKVAGKTKRSIEVAQSKRADGPDSLVSVVTGVRSGRREEMLVSIKRGLKFASIGHLVKGFRTPRKDIARILSIASTTMNRRKAQGRLLPDESDRVVRLAQLKDAALVLMNFDDEAAVSWLHTPNSILGGESPLEHASTEVGARDVEDLIGRLRHGVFS